MVLAELANIRLWLSLYLTISTIHTLSKKRKRNKGLNLENKRSRPNISVAFETDHFAMGYQFALGIRSDAFPVDKEGESFCIAQCDTCTTDYCPKRILCDMHEEFCLHSQSFVKPA